MTYYDWRMAIDAKYPDNYLVGIYIQAAFAPGQKDETDDNPNGYGLVGEWDSKEQSGVIY